MDIGAHLKKLRISKKMSQEDLAKALNEKYGTKFNKGMISKWENNREEPRMESIRYLLDYFNASLDELLGLPTTVERKKTYYSNVSEYPFIPVAVSAGLPVGIEPVTETETIIVPDEILGKYAGSKNIYFTKVNGESMNKVIPNNSLIAVKQIEPHELKNGDIVVYSNGYEYAVKRFYKYGNRLIFKPESTDPQFTDYIINDSNCEELRLHGKVVAYVVNLE